MFNSGRDGIWTVCSVTDPDEVFLTLASEPYFNQRSDPVYVRRLREHECDWNQETQVFVLHPQRDYVPAGLFLVQLMILQSNPF